MSVYILDVRLPETFERGHVPDSVSNPVFQIGFLDRMPADWSKTDPIQVIGEDAESQEAQVAAEKLSRAGYTEVAILEGGYQAWRTAHDGSEAPAETPATLPDGDLPVDLKASEIQWTGRNLLNAPHQRRGAPASAVCGCWATIGLTV